ncbi:hypothetical protein JCM11641_003184 [Rhodosporidiobolus odoratus]
MAAPSPMIGNPLAPLSPSSTSPLSPEIVQSLRIPWLDLGVPRIPSSQSSVASSTSSSSSAGISPISQTAMEPDTLAMRRMKAATARARPPIFRRRSRSLDDVNARDAESAAMEMRSEVAEREAREEIRIDAAAAALVPPSRGAVLSPLTASTDSSFASLTSDTTIPTSTTTSSWATTAPSPFTPCRMTSDLSSMTALSSLTFPPQGLPALTRSASESILPLSAYTPTEDFPSMSFLPLMHPPQSSPCQPARIGGYPPVSSPSSLALSRSYSSHDTRLSNWVSAVSAASSLAQAADAAQQAPASSRVKLPLPPPRQPFSPVLPSPLSTCSYNSNADAEGEGAERAPEDGFPFPQTPVIGSYTGASASPSSSQASSPAAASVRSAPVLSPSLLRSSFIGSSGGISEQRPPLQSFGSASTTVTACSMATDETADTCTAAPSPRSRPAAASSSPGPSRVVIEASKPVASPASPVRPPPLAAAPRTRSVSSTVGTSTSFSFPSVSFNPASSARPLSQTRSASSAAGAGATGRHGAPLTPPESLCTAPYLAGASASELAWHDVLNARMGALASAVPLAPAASAVGKGKEREREFGNGEGAEGDKTKSATAELMGSAAAGGFAASTRERMGELMETFLEGVPLGEGEDVVNVVEYGAMNSRSASLVPPILSHFAARQLSILPPAPDPDSLLSFQITHAALPSATGDFRCLAQSAEDTYMRSGLAKEDRVFAAFAARPFGAKVHPKGSVSVGFSAMSLHWPSMERKFRIAPAAPATLAHGELMTFLAARAAEFKTGGLLTLAYIARSEEASTALAPSSMPTTPAGSPPLPLREGRSASVPTLPAGIGARTAGGGGVKPPLAQSSTSPPAPVIRKKDIWAHLTGVLGKAIQRLVSTGLLKPQVARQLLALPLHPRTPLQTRACLQASSHSWLTLHSSITTISHPAWKGVEHGTVSPESWADHTIQLLKIFWEGEMRSILREALGSRGACEWVLDCLWTVAKEKLEELPPHPLDLEVQLVALRRREKAPSLPSSPVIDGTDGVDPGASQQGTAV